MRLPSLVPLLLAAAVTVAACGGGGPDLTVYSGRSEVLIGPLITAFEADTGLDVEVRYGDSGELAATLLEEGANSPADVFFAQDPASLGRVALAGLFAPLPADVLAAVPARFADTGGRWVGTSGRARVVVYDTGEIDPADLPAGEDGFVAERWRGRVAVAPTNGSFLAFVAAKILLDGEEATAAWLRGMAANDAPRYAGNSAIVAAVDAGEVDAGLVNHYYLFRLIAEQGASNAANHFFTSGSAGALIMPAGAGILAAGDAGDAATRFVEYLLSVSAQEYFAAETFEYPLVEGIAAHPDLPPLESLPTPPLDLSRLAEQLDTATDLVSDAGLL